MAPGEEEEEDAGGGGEEGEPVEGAPGGRGVAAGDQVGQHQRHRVTREDVVPAVHVPAVQCRLGKGSKKKHVFYPHFVDKRFTPPPPPPYPHFDIL